jgi:nicotinamide-nucleotide amidase
METMFLQFVLPELAVTNEIMFTRSWNIFLLSESIIEQKLFELQTLVRQLLPESRISYQAHLGYVTWSITVPVITSEQERVAKILEDEVTAGLRAALGDYILYSDERSCHDYFVSEMSSRNLSFSCAESCTGGLMSSEITSVSGSSRMFLGGVVSYSSTSKSDLLGVEPRALDRFGAVSTQVAAQMAFGVRSAFSSDVAISVTGVAGPGGGTTVHPVGSVCFGMAISLLRIVNLQELVRVLAVFGWTPVARNHEGFVKQKSIELVAERKFGAGLSRDDIQHRSTIFAIGSVIAILNMLK